VFLEYDDGVMAYDPDTGETRQYAPLAGWILLTAQTEGRAGFTVAELAQMLEAAGDELQTVSETLEALAAEGALERR
jgi:hypothetical protein